jgi:ATP-dependent DNA ligase
MRGHPYFSGVRSDRWLKVKVRQKGRFLIGGFSKDRGGWATLLLGTVAEGKLRYVGGVRFGVNAAAGGETSRVG